MGADPLFSSSGSHGASGHLPHAQRPGEQTQHSCGDLTLARSPWTTQRGWAWGAVGREHLLHARWDLTQGLEGQRRGLLRGRHQGL